MKKLLSAILFLLSLSIAYAQLVSDKLALPGDVSLFLDETKYLPNMLKQKDDKMSSFSHSTFVAPQVINGVEMIEAIIAFDDNGVMNALRANGVIIECEFDGFVTARIPVDRLEQISLLNGVKDVSISRVLDFCTDSTLRVTHAGKVINGSDNGLPQDYDGSGVILGIIDAGFDYQHSAFKFAKDPTKSRIVRVYDPNNSTGHVVKLGNNILSGSVFMGSQIDTMTTDSKNASHGTHTASIAAGRHVNGYGGMAPGSDIVLCTSRTLNSGISENEVINCMRYIYAYADSVGKPCVISLSVSTSAGSHDGKDYLSRAIKQLLGPGRLFVIAAGNTASQKFYVHGLAKKEKPANFLIDCYSGTNNGDNYYYSDLIAETWVRSLNTYPNIKFHILDKRSNRIVWESEPVTSSSFFSNSELKDFYEPDSSVNNVGYIYASISRSVYCSKYKITTKIGNLKSKSYYVDYQGRRISNYRIGFSVYPEKVDSFYVDNWMATSTGRFGQKTTPIYVDSIDENGETITMTIEDFYAIPDNSSSIGSYAVCDSVISAGAYVARNSYYSLNYNELKEEPWAWIGGIYSSSGYQSPGSGPTGEPLPTITAPGYDVVAAGSRYSYFNTDYRGELVMRDDEGSVWGIMTGTSMAAPAVAGIIAQWLQLCPDLCPSQVKDVIAHTAIKDANTNSTSQFGPNGKIDALAGIIYLIKNDPHFIIGDVNGDGVVSVLDASLMIDRLLGADVPGFNPVAADVNQDGYFSILDVVSLIDSLLENSGGGDED